MSVAPKVAVLTRTHHSYTSRIEGANFLNLLLVDDDRIIREACRDVAQSLGFNAHVAESVEHAYRLLDTSSDISKSGSNGNSDGNSSGGSSADVVLLAMRPGAALNRCTRSRSIARSW